MSSDLQPSREGVGNGVGDEIIALIPTVPSGDEDGHPTVPPSNEKIGRGGQGTVYKVKFRGGMIAAKTIPDSSEYEILSNLNHPNIIKAICRFHHGYGMQLCDGDLCSLRKAGPMEESEIKTIAKQSLDALSYLNTQNIVHRDIKPQNILVSKSSNAGEQIKIADFGFARAGAEETTVAGTPIYIAPEALTGATPSHKQDIYGLGLVIYYLITGKHAYEKLLAVECIPTLFALGENFSPDRYEAPSVKGLVSVKLAAIVKRCLALDPNNRLTAAELLNDPYFKAEGDGDDGFPRVALYQATVHRMASESVWSTGQQQQVSADMR